MRISKIRQKSFVVAREYAKSINRIRYWRQKTLRVHGDNSDFGVVLFIQSHLRICQQYLSLYGEYA
jgi:hypothetical protein